MKLHVELIRDPDTGREIVQITDDRGERVPCIRSAKISIAYDEASEIHLTLVVDRKNVTLGTTIGTVAELAGPGKGS